MVKAPVVHVAGMLRTTGTPITIGAYGWLLAQMGQYPFQPPSVAGWDWGPAWLSTTRCAPASRWSTRSPPGTARR